MLRRKSVFWPALNNLRAAHICLLLACPKQIESSSHVCLLQPCSEENQFFWPALNNLRAAHICLSKQIKSSSQLDVET
jgi:hypothetical protein